MRKLVVRVLALLSVLVLLWIILDREEPRPSGLPPAEGPPEVESPAPPGNLPPPDAEPPEPAPPEPGFEPNIGGEVINSSGRLLPGVPVVAVSVDGHVVGRTETDENGRFDMLIDHPTLFCVILEPEGGVAPRFDRNRRREHLPCLDLILIRATNKTERGVLYVHGVPDSWPGDREMRVRVYDKVAEKDVDRSVRLVDSPWRFEDVPYGVYLVRVEGEGLAGVVRGFEFNTGDATVSVPLRPDCRLRVRPSLPARVLLIGQEPKLPRHFLNDQLITGRVPGVWVARGIGRAEEVVFSGLAAGPYTLLICGPGCETIEKRITLAPGGDRDLGEIEVRKASGEVVLRVTDQEDEGLRFPYLVSFYADTGVAYRRKLGPGKQCSTRFRGLAEGVWRYRVARMVGGEGHTRSVGSDRVVQVKAGQVVEVVADCTWKVLEDVPDSLIK